MRVAEARALNRALRKAYGIASAQLRKSGHPSKRRNVPGRSRTFGLPWPFSLAGCGGGVPLGSQNHFLDAGFVFAARVVHPHCHFAVYALPRVPKIVHKFK